MMDLGPEVAGSQKTDDLFVFTVEHVTLKKGERMVLPATEFSLKYRDVYSINLPFAPPPEVYRRFNSNQRAELARLLNAPKVMHAIRLTNKSDYPLTTAPALILRADRLLAQGMMTYTATGATTDLEVTAAVDLPVKKSDVETKRTPNAVRWNGDDYTRVDLQGTITVANHLADAVDLEMSRCVLGNVNSSDHDGKIEKVNVFEEGRYFLPGDYPSWWNWYDWPHWWRHLNGFARITWKTSLQPSKSVDLGYTWHYFWR